MNYYPMNDSGWVWGMVMMLLWLVFFVVIAMVVIRSFRGQGVGPMHGADPLDIIKERYAKGDITKEQYDQLKKDIR